MLCHASHIWGPGQNGKTGVRCLCFPFPERLDLATSAPSAVLHYLHHLASWPAPSTTGPASLARAGQCCPNGLCWPPSGSWRLAAGSSPTFPWPALTAPSLSLAVAVIVAGAGAYIVPRTACTEYKVTAYRQIARHRQSVSQSTRPARLAAAGLLHASPPKSESAAAG